MVYSGLKHELYRKNKSYNDIARELGTYPATICNKINGRARFTIDEVKKISTILEFDKDRILAVFFE